MPAVKNSTTLGNMGRVQLDAPNGTVTLSKVFDFEWRRTEKKEARGFLTGERDKFSFPDGYQGKFSFDRTDGAAENELVAQDAAMDGTGTYQNWIITFQVTDPTGNGTQKFIFQGAAVTISEGGSYKQNSVVTSTITFEAATMNYVVVGQ